MKLEQQVCSLDLAKRLKELGVKQESYFYWATYKLDKPDKSFKNGIFLTHTLGRFANSLIIPVASAFTVAELGEMLPANVQLPFKRPIMNTNKDRVRPCAAALALSAAA
jgi:hypothetical protein